MLSNTQIEDKSKNRHKKYFDTQLAAHMKEILDPTKTLFVKRRHKKEEMIIELET